MQRLSLKTPLSPLSVHARNPERVQDGRGVKADESGKVQQVRKHELHNPGHSKTGSAIDAHDKALMDAPAFIPVVPLRRHRRQRLPADHWNLNALRHHREGACESNKLCFEGRRCRIGIFDLGGKKLRDGRICSVSRVDRACGCFQWHTWPNRLPERCRSTWGKSPVTQKDTSFTSLKTMMAKLVGMVASIPSGALHWPRRANHPHFSAFRHVHREGGTVRGTQILSFTFLPRVKERAA